MESTPICVDNGFVLSHLEQTLNALR